MMISMSLRAPANRAVPAAALVAAVAATVSAYYAIRRYRRSAARALSASLVERLEAPPRSQSSTGQQATASSSVGDAEPLQPAQQPAQQPSDSPDSVVGDRQATHVSRNAPQRTFAVYPTSPLHPLVKPATACSRQFSWMVFWDLENTCVPSSTPPAVFVHALCSALRAITPQPCASHPQPVLRILAVANIHKTPLQQRKALQSNGVSILHFETDGRKDACDKALITELCLLTREHAPPMGVALLSSDVDFAYALSRLTALGYYTTVITPNVGTLSRQLASVPKAILTFDQILAHVSQLIVPQSQQNPNAKSASAQQGSDQKQRAPRNARRRQQKHKSPKRAPVVSDANLSMDNANPELRRRKAPQRGGANDANVSPVMRPHSANVPQSHEPHFLTPRPRAARFRYAVYGTVLLSVLCTLAVLLGLNYYHSLLKT